MASILGLAAVAFVCDRVFLQDGPAATPAVPTEVVKNAAHEEAKGVAAAEPGVDPSAPTLAERLKKAAPSQAEAGSNPFNPKWRGVAVATPKQDAKKSSKPEVKIEATPEGFAASHALSSVSKDVAMISKRPYTVGKVVDGWTLREVSVSKLMAKLERGSLSVELHIRATEPGAMTQKHPEGDPLDGDR